jgi:hypothetical protein
LTTTKPVTQTADVEVNKASMSPGDTPADVDTGSIRRTVPTRITAANELTISLVGVAQFFET